MLTTDVHTDGADVCRQGSQESTCWPILLRANSIQPNEWSEKKVLWRMMAPKTVGIFIGKGKPHSSTVYLERFAHELYHLNPRNAEEEEPFCVTRFVLSIFNVTSLYKQSTCTWWTLASENFFFVQ